MLKNSISKEDVYVAALELQKAGASPNTINVRAKLNGRGSQTTIHKHLSQWKKLYANTHGDNIDELRSQLALQLKINENLSVEILHSSTLGQDQRAEIAKLAAKNLQLEALLDAKEQLNLQLSSNFNQAQDRIQASFDSMLTLLTEQIRTINEQAITKVQEAGQYFDDKIMQAKLEIRELKEQLGLKDKELKKYAQGLPEACE
jgi:hypothetical protein